MEKLEDWIAIVVLETLEAPQTFKINFRCFVTSLDIKLEMRICIL